MEGEGAGEPGRAAEAGQERFAVEILDYAPRQGEGGGNAPLALVGDLGSSVLPHAPEERLAQGFVNIFSQPIFHRPTAPGSRCRRSMSW